MATKVIIEKGSDSTYSVYLDVEGIGANGVGSTLEKAKEDLLVCMDEVIEYLKEEGREIPAYLTERQFIYKYDIAELLEQFSWINASELARRVGINPSLMRQYKSRANFASKKQLLKIQEGIKGMARELEEAYLVF